MATPATLISVEEYLNTSYHPDCDYIDGEVLERNMGETPHARLQGFFLRYFSAHEDEWNIEALGEQRVQVGPTRFRIPDVMVAALPNHDPLIVRSPPILCVEILSSEDRMRRIQQRIDDYARMGVRSMWVVDPWRRKVFASASDAILHETDDRLTVEGTAITITVPAIWTELDRLERRAAAARP